MLLSLDDPIWPTLEGGYRMPYDVAAALKAMQAGEDVWHELWEELHHQGDVGVASYAAVPQLVHMLGNAQSREEDFYALIALIELERHRPHNPPLPDWLAASYQAAWAQLPAIAARDLQGQFDPVMLESVFAVLALPRASCDWARCCCTWTRPKRMSGWKSVSAGAKSMAQTPRS